METAEEEHEQDVVTSSLSPDSVIDNLDKFLEKPENERILTPELEQILVQISKTGYSCYPWEKIKPLFLKKLNSVLNEFNAESNMDKLDIHPNVDRSTFEELKSDIIDRINSFENAPFTIQRLCELILSPRANYRRTDKFIRGLTKCVSVVTTIDNEGNKIYIEPTRNGLTSSSSTIELSETPTNSQITNGFAIPHSVNDNDSMTIESQESQAGSTTNTQLDDEMEQDNNDNEQDEDEAEEEEEEEEEEDKPSSSSSPPPNLTDENSSSSNSNSTPLPSSSTEDMIEQ
ncbi:unnamed protein product [Rotaria sp. Silwood1]|nr:unnamed protein product [Rotaria sp. Silwood1]CAF1077696.1 unnamed protein product [Rotaria sp. Silwood1]CAF3411971.1 unnamed protein product [Rotaria sp. Silwood1]CAF3437246.1 unnamed protein product [Rotaria sp. Silwood1]CAF4484400.1 unnamed protein product [Rotaria sp. Silwood1]